ncbi:sorbitol dehydrogenase-like protein [Zychaea mexicana]|uniref:sorbitol dehydrogenase-like protein n=1 Tax=Zychaea mexicana TaxID=64656 RepID=UPI0022FDBAE8|nr:sorbitol dehydrogenase-like protein [Zychaea mexicana]KAI9487998.1 sorbitol dehydrogenase-like protein [Zychaea mexicana]
MVDKNNISTVLVGPEKIEMRQMPIPEIGPFDVLINVKVTGICGSDVHFYKHCRMMDFQVTEPIVLGHESAGVVVATGDQVTRVKTGDRVAIEPGVTCRTCDMCKAGMYNLCPDCQFRATPPTDGTLSNYISHPEDFLFKIPDGVSLEEGALIEPLSVGMYAVERANVKPADTVLVLGAGPVGLLTCAAARAAGASEIIVADLVPSRLEFAKAYNSDAQLLLERPQKGEPNIEYARRMSTHIIKELGGRRADTVIDCTGAETCVQMTVLLTKNGGSAVLVGLGASTQTLPVAEITGRQVDIKGVFRYCNTYPRAISMLKKGHIDVKPLITHKYPIAKSKEAFLHAVEGRDGAIKIQIINDHV